MPTWIQKLNVEIGCLDCREILKKLTPNHKRCPSCAYKIALKRANEHAKNTDPAVNRQRASDWYYRNRDYKLLYMKKLQLRHS